MPRYQLPRTPKGFRQPGSGRAKGTPNRISVEVKTFVSELVNNPHYQAKLRRDFMARKIHPTIESLVWSYHLGRPAQPIEVRGGLALDVSARLAEERAAFAALDIADLEQIAAESRALVNRAFALAKMAANENPKPEDVVVEAKPAKRPPCLRAATAMTDDAASSNERAPPRPPPPPPRRRSRVMR